MVYPSITAFYVAIFALIYVGLSFWVTAGRVTGDTLFGQGDDALMKRVRSHANFIEYVPFALLLIALLEAGGASAGLVQTLLIVLLIARLAHPVGMFAAKNSPVQFACRGGGILLTAIVYVVAAVDLLIR